MEMINLTGLAVAHLIGLDGEGFEHLTVVVKGTFDLGPTIEPSDEQPVVRLADEYAGDPASTPLVAAGEAAPFKPATDVLLLGAAYPRGKTGTEVLVGMRVGTLQKGLQVFGDRRWEGLMGVYRPGTPAPFTRIPLGYDRAFGGRDDWADPPEASDENPAGVGFRGKRSRRSVNDGVLPNFESPTDLLTSPDQRPAPAGFGAVAPFWPRRRRLAGTMDDRWLKTRAPLLPRDFDPRFHQVAPADQIYPGYVRGGELVVVTGMRPEGNLRFELPVLRPEISVKVGGEEVAVASPCDTVTIDTERQQVSMIWRGGLRVHGRVPRVRWIRVGEAAP